MNWIPDDGTGGGAPRRRNEPLSIDDNCVVPPPLGGIRRNETSSTIREIDIEQNFTIQHRIVQLPAGSPGAAP